MANNKQFGGMSIYKYKGRNIYYDVFTKKAYIISQSDVKTYSLYTAFIPLSIVIACILNVSFSVKPIICVVIGVLLLIISLVLFRVLFIYKLPYDNGFVKPKRENLFASINERMSLPRIVISWLLSVAMIVITIYSIKTNSYSIEALIGCSVVVLISLFINIICIVSLIKRKDNKKNSG